MQTWESFALLASAVVGPDMANGALRLVARGASIVAAGKALIESDLGKEVAGHLSERGFDLRILAEMVRNGLGGQTPEQDALTREVIAARGVATPA